MASSAIAYLSLGCYQDDPNSQATLVITKKGSLQLEECVSSCLDEGEGVKLVAVQSIPHADFQNSTCKCIKENTPYEYQVNNAECINECTDNFICGGALNRITIYNISLSDLPESTTVTNVDTGKGQSTPPTTMILALLFAVLALVISIASIWLYMRFRKRSDNSKSTFPRLPRVPTSSYLIADLPKTKEMIYSAERDYTSELCEELKVSAGDVIAVRSTFDDEWCVATNLSTGESGFMPLAVLISKDATNVTIKARIQSLDEC